MLWERYISAVNLNRTTAEEKLRTLVRRIVKERETKNTPPKGRVPVGWPQFDDKEIMGALDSLLDMRISQGPKVRTFEALCARYIGKRYAVAVNSGSSANLLALSALIASGEVARGSEVIIPATTFATVASPIIQVGLVPVYVDVDPISWNIDPREIEKAIGPKTKVVMPVHTFGNPSDMPKIMRIARKHKLIVLEDCCEAHGASISKRNVGSFGDMATLSFFVAHNITTGEGGMIFTDSKKHYDLLRSLREFGRLPDTREAGRFRFKDLRLSGYDTRYIFSRLGYNVRMTDITAALGIEQIEKLDLLNGRRASIAGTYSHTLKKYESFLQLPHVADNAFHSWYAYPFMVRKNAQFTRMDLVRFLENHGIETRPFFGGCLPDQPGFRNEVKRVVGQLPVARDIVKHSVFIGCHPALTKKHIAHVLATFDSFFRQF